MAHTTHTRSKENQPINVVDDGNYQVRKKQYNFFVQARKKEMRRKMRQKLKGREGRWALNSSKNKYRFFPLKTPACLTPQYTATDFFP